MNTTPTSSCSRSHSPSIRPKPASVPSGDSMRKSVKVVYSELPETGIICQEHSKEGVFVCVN